jgi:hypothetical protein
MKNANGLGLKQKYFLTDKKRAPKGSLNYVEVCLICINRYVETHGDTMKDKSTVKSTEATLAYQREYYQRNKEKVKARVKGYIADNPDKHAKYVSEYAKRNPDIGKAAYNKHTEENRGSIHWVQRAMVSKSKSRARQKGLEHTITIEYIKSIWPADNMCPVFRTEFVSSKENMSTCASLDRIDNTKGYIEGNVAVISWKANSLKSNGSLHELEAVVDYVKRMLTF